ncbi:MAG: hypothetical protein IPM63_02610 [Acidobacteriota bacterium]|nr:MAG: hypothetical protein IPM63_02610 [Acidobacteriota bacterium]
MSSDSPYHSLTDYGGHTKRIVIIAVLVLSAIALIYYFSLPGHGDSVGIPPDLGIAVRDHFKENQNRNVTQMRGFRCDSFDNGGTVIDAPDGTVKVELEIRPAREEEDARTSRWTALATYRGDRQWEINAIQMSPDSEDGDPCKK